ncbi:hypothetical protein A2Z67_03010 [Candidatus Woesebacteria bacterium RBG_13_36_22]|uniref:DUF5666 domain-containing protein n=1 Tax=Candidatus Woesebacteria bacterium RBG_13_36_22 TaxID=1802478 RepID=A0A1F7X618_9BACT|nr:MAG: hypothetical protein A2Z67_03010 [Candidatus Woesebacteria bacterium RBG_13_36_22]
MKKIIPIFVALILVVGGGAFYGGVKYQQSKGSFSNLTRQNFQNLSEEQRQQLLQGNIGGSFQRGIGGGAGTNFLNGEVIGKDEQSLTLKMPDGGSKIVFFSGSTKILKTTDGSIDDIGIGEQIMVSGEQNSDGSYTAQTIQERQLPLQNNSK